MDGQQNSILNEAALFVISGVASCGAIVAGFLWNFICSVRREGMAYIKSVKEIAHRDNEALRTHLQKETEIATNRIVENERRFALKSDVDVLREHIDDTYAEHARQMNGRFDQITNLIMGSLRQ